MNALLLIGRACFSAIFLMSGPNHFGADMIGYAASHGVPAAGLLVPLSGVIATAGGLCLLLGWRARFGAWLLILFLLPVTFTMHRYWGLADPAAAMMQQAHFWKNISMLGGAIAFAYFGAGPYSLDSRRMMRRLLPQTREPARERALH